MLFLDIVTRQVRAKVFHTTTFIRRWLNDVPSYLYVQASNHQQPPPPLAISNRLLILFWPKVLNFQVNQFYHLCVCASKSASAAEKKKKTRKENREKKLWIGFIILRQIQCNLMRENPIVFAIGFDSLIFSALNYNIECFGVILCACASNIYSALSKYTGTMNFGIMLSVFVFGLCETYRRIHWWNRWRAELHNG